jgi:hypothetical protein
MNKNDRRKALVGIRVGLIIALSLCFTVDAQAKLRTLYYLPYANFQIQYKPNPYQSKQVIFLGTVRSTTCNEKNRASFRWMIPTQFTKHIESKYGDRLGVRAEWQERLGYWRWDSGEELIALRERIAKRYPNVEYIDTFFFDCGATQSFNLIQSGNFSDFGSQNSAWGKGQYSQHGIWWNSGKAQSSAQTVTLRSDDKLYMQQGIQTALLITNKSPRGPHVFGTTVQQIKGQPGQTYRITIWAASENTPNNNAVSIAVEPTWGQRPINIKGGTYSWTRYEGKFTADASGVIQLRILTEDVCKIWLTGFDLAPDEN